MKIKHWLLVSSITLFSSSAFATDILLSNNTKSPATGSIGYICSSIAGDDGVAAPHSSLTIPQALIDKYCSGKNCDIQVYMSNNCSAHKAGTVTVDQNKGVVNVVNQNKEGYILSGSGSIATIDGGPKKGLLDFLFG